MQKIGQLAEAGFTREEIASVATRASGVELHNLMQLLPDAERKALEAKGVSATVAVIRNGVDQLLGSGSSTSLIREIKAQRVDKMAKMRGKVVNKKARWNNCFGDAAQEPDYAAGKGTVIAFSSVPHMTRFREALPRWFGAKARAMQAETNHYYDVRKTYIGFHGDSERKLVVCGRFGAMLPLHYQWYHEGVAIGRPLRLELNHGDLYAMSEKATGFDWRTRKEPTLRHAAGYNSVLSLP